MSTTAPEKLDLASHEGHKVKITRTEDDPKTKQEVIGDVEGTVEAVGPMGVLLKVKGRSNAILILNHEIKAIKADDSKETLTASKVKPVKENRVRRHLLNAHGWTLTQVNAITDEQAMIEHEKAHVENKDLGHVHVEGAKDDDKTE